jgi:sugar/nucleoside kinase (ribokinase family)
MDIVAKVDYPFLERFHKKPGTMHLVEYDEVEALLGEIRSYRMMPGGSAANTARGVAWLNNTRLVAGEPGEAAEQPGEAAEQPGEAAEQPVFNGAVGKDAMGDAFIERLESMGVAVSIVRKAAPTGVSVILVTPDGERTMNTHLGACRSFTVSDLDTDRLAQSRLLYLTGYLWDTDNQREAAEAAAVFSKSGGRSIPVAFDLADPFAVRRYSALFREWIPGRVDVLFGNRDELSLLTESHCDEDCVMASSGLAPITVMKVGEGGCLVGWEGRCELVPGVAVKVVDTTGAGDAFAAGFLHAMMNGADPLACARRANWLASRVVGSEGCCY